MSEYQYYEWLALDRPLTDQERVQVGRLSSHMDVVTSTQAIVTYHWSGFKHDPIDVLLRYFDAMLYWANWGSRRLAFRFPKGAIDTERIEAYWVDEWMALRESGNFVALGVDVSEEEPPEFEVEPPDLGALTRLRERIMEGDGRALYLVWLKAVEEMVLPEEEREPPLPPGLGALDGSLQAFADYFLDLDPLLLQAAAQASAPLQPEGDERLAAALAHLAPEECRAYLRRLLAGEPQVRSSLRKRLLELAGGPAQAPRQGTRTALELLQRAEELRREERRRQEEARERKRRQRLDDLAAHEGEAWREVERLIEQKQSKAYQQAVDRLKELRELAQDRGTLPEFEARLAAVRAQYGGRPALMDLLKKAKL
jgi:hypothetical protein